VISLRANRPVCSSLWLFAPFARFFIGARAPQPTRAFVLVAGFALAVASGLGCRNLERFDTGASGAYCGRIIDSDFTRAGFARGLGLRLTLDIDALDVAPGTLTTDDTAPPAPCSPLPEFDNAPLLVTPALFADPLSQLEFGGTRDYNFMAWVDSTCQGSALAVVSLMHTGQVEVRLLRRGTGAVGDTSAGDTAAEQFGVFQLERNDCVF
jgi:hypothetical protein